MTRQEKWDRRFLGVAEIIARWSKDPSTPVGAMLVNPQTNEIISCGYNGFPRGVEDSLERLSNRDLKYQLVVHAEENAILSAGHRARGSRLYVWPSFMLPPVCARCCASAIQAGLYEIVGFELDESQLDERQSHWKESILLARKMCEEAGVFFRGIKREG